MEVFENIVNLPLWVVAVAAGIAGLVVGALGHRLLTLSAYRRMAKERMLARIKIGHMASWPAGFMCGYAEACRVADRSDLLTDANKQAVSDMATKQAEDSWLCFEAFLLIGGWPSRQLSTTGDAPSKT